MINADVEGQLLGSDAQFCLDPTIELATCDVKLLGNGHERHVALCHVVGHYPTELSNK